jgi:hypothetical protein
VTGFSSGRFQPLVAEILEAAGWRDGRRDEPRAQSWALTVASYASPDGRQHQVVPAAIDAYAEFGGVSVHGGAPGEQTVRSSFSIDPLKVLPSVRTLAALSEAIGAPLTPLGEEGDGVGILSVDGYGRVFLLDHAGDWYLGSTVDEALTTLVLGRQPVRLNQDGTWR